MHSKNLYTYGIMLFCTMAPYLVQAQYSLGFSGGYMLGFNSSSIHVTNQLVEQDVHEGYQFNVWNGYQFKKQPIEITTRLGFKKMISEGAMHGKDFSSETYKFQLGAGALYHFESDFTLGALFMLENNLDTDQFISQTADLFRTSFQMEASYPVWKSLAIRVHYCIALTPLADHYLMINPQHQFGLGLQYKIL